MNTHLKGVDGHTSFFTTQSLVTGNAGGRIACANIHAEEHGAFGS